MEKQGHNTVQTLSRRRLLQTGTVAAALALAGCGSDEADEDKIATVIRRNPAELTDPGSDPIEVEALVHNIGQAADVEVSIEVVDLDGDIATTESTTESFERDEQRTVTIDVTPGPDGDVVFAEAEAK